MANPLLTASPDIVVAAGGSTANTEIHYVTGGFSGSTQPVLWERRNKGSWDPVDLARVTRSDAHDINTDGYFSASLAPGVLYQVRLYHASDANPASNEPRPDYEIGVPALGGPTRLISDRAQLPGGTYYGQEVATGSSPATVSTATNFFLQVGVSPPITDPNGLKHLTSPLHTGFDLLNTFHRLDLPTPTHGSTIFPAAPLLPGNAFFAVGLVFDASGRWETFAVPFNTRQRQVVIKYQELHIINNGKRFPDVGPRHAQFWIWVREGNKTVDSKFFGNIHSFSIQDGDHIDLFPLAISATVLGPEKVTADNHDLGILIRGLVSHEKDSDEPCANYFFAEQFPDDPPVQTPPETKFHFPTGPDEAVLDQEFVVRATPQVTGNEFEFEIKVKVTVGYFI